MQENEFEKRIQQEMGGLRLRPSDAVWDKVEEQLKKKKRRRVVFFIFLLAGLSLLGYTGYFITKTNSKQNLVQQDNDILLNNNKSEPGNDQPVLPTREDKTVKDQPAANRQKLPITKEKDQEEKSVNVLHTEKVTKVGNDIAGKHREISKGIKLDKDAIAKSTAKGNTDITKANTQSSEIKILPNDRSSKDPVDRVNTAQQDIAKNNLPGDNQLIAQSGADIIPDQKINESAKTDSVIVDSKIDEAVATAKKKQPGSKIKWGIDLSAGKSSSRDNAFSILDIFETNKSLAMDYNSPGNASGGGGLSNARISPSDIKAGPAFRAGILGEMKISKRSSISSGLQYVYHSNKIQVGYYSDTTVVLNNSFSQASRVDAIYRGTHQKEYTNRFHFIQIPVHYQWQLNKGVKLPILWSIGASAGYLFATNGLVYDTTASGIYYRDNDAFNKFQFNLNTGLSFRFGNKRKIQWSLGPEFSLGMNKLMKDDFTKKQFLLYSGLTGRLFFQKRNK